MSNNPRPRAYPRAHADNNPHWDQERSAEAVAQGWDVFDCGDGLAIQRIDCPEDGSQPRFATDDEAIQLVQVRAKNGDPLAKAALAEVATHPRGTVKREAPPWKNLFPNADGWYFVSTPKGEFPINVFGDPDGLRFVSSAYLGIATGCTLGEFCRMYVNVKWFGPIKVPAVDQF